MADPVKVTVSDPATGEVLGEQVIDDDYVLVCAGTAHLASTQVHPETGTHQLVVKGARRGR